MSPHTKPAPVSMPPTPQQHVQLAAFAARLTDCAHGEAEAIYAEATAAFGVSRQTLCVWLKPHRLTTRKRRSDHGRSSVSGILQVSSAVFVFSSNTMFWLPSPAA